MGHIQEFNWELSEKWQDLYICTMTFNGCKYEVCVIVEEKKKSTRFWIHASSGKKRAELEIYEDKPQKSIGGLEALFWIKKAVLSFPEFYQNRPCIHKNPMFICVGWADNRRRNIYSRLQKEGFRFATIEGRKILMKKIKTPAKIN